YKTYKQCVVWDDYPGNRTGAGQDTLREFAKSYKMNTHIRRVFFNTVTNKADGSPCKITDMKRSAETVLVGDGQSLDQTGPIVSQAESGQFSMDVNFTGTGTAGNAIRHRGGSNICFADGHVQWIVLPTITRAMSNGARPAQQ